MKTRLLSAISTILLFTGIGFAQTWPLNVCSYDDNLPFSNSAGEGLEDRIAELVATELGAHVVNVPVEPPFTDVRDYMLSNGDCDVVMAVNDGQPGFLTTLTYYRSIYSFLYAPDNIPPVTSYDDPALADYRIGVLRARGSGISPVTQALAVRDLIPNQVTFLTDVSQPNPLLELPQAVTEGRVDIAVLWGPVAGYAARESGGQLVSVPVKPEIDMPLNIMYLNIAMGVRLGDDALRDELSYAIARSWTSIQEVLEEFNVPLMPLPAPSEVRP